MFTQKKTASILIAAATTTLILSGCNRNNTQSEPSGPPAPQTSTITIGVHDTAGIPTEGITVVANQKIGDLNAQIAEGTTDSNGTTTLTLPENTTIAIGLWKQQPGLEVVYAWQTPFIVPTDDTTLAYSYWIETTDCSVVQPGGTQPCPDPEPSKTSDTATPQPTG